MTTHTENRIRKRMNEIAELGLRNEKLVHDSIAMSEVSRNTERICELEKEVIGLAGEAGIDAPISSDDGTFVVYRKRVGQSGVDMEHVIRTGIIQWLAAEHPEFLVPDLVRIKEELGMDLSAYAKRPAYDMYTVSKDEDFRKVLDILERYKKKKEME